MDKIRAEFEARRDKEMMSRYRWCDDEKRYKQKEGYAFSDGGNYWKAEHLTIALYSFIGGYEAAKASKWIKTSERMPEINKRVLVNDSGGFGVLSGRLGHAGWYLEGNLDLSCNVTKWMPLPEAPE